jgi:hypothetical protein
MIKLTDREISPYVWVHPVEEVGWKGMPTNDLLRDRPSVFKTGETALRGIFSSA